MKAVEALIVWTPDREPTKGWPLAGRVDVTTNPPPQALQPHQNSVGACLAGWRDATPVERLQLVEACFVEMIHRDGIEEATARAALGTIDEFRGHHFSAKLPEGGSILIPRLRVLLAQFGTPNCGGEIT